MLLLGRWLARHGLDGMRTSLKGIRDMERLATQLAYQRSNARDLVARPTHWNECRPSPVVQDSQDPLLMHLSEGLEQLNEMMETVQHTLNQEAPLGLRDSGLLRLALTTKWTNFAPVTSEGKAWFCP